MRAASRWVGRKVMAGEVTSAGAANYAERSDMSVRYCELCRMPDHMDHEPWCTRGDAGERSPFAIIWGYLDELDEKIDRLAKQLGLPEDWDDE